MYKHILIATDGSELAGKAVAAGFALARELKASVTAVTVTEPWTALSSSRMYDLPSSDASDCVDVMGS